MAASVAMAGLISARFPSSSSSSVPSSSSSSSPLLPGYTSLHPSGARFGTQFLSIRKESMVAVVRAVAAEVLTTESPSEVKETEKNGDGENDDTPSGLKLESEADILKKKQKRAELRRKRLVRKRHLRKKGRWPPSKMAKLKNV